MTERNPTIGAYEKSLIDKALADAPPLSDEQLRRIASIMTPRVTPQEAGK